MRNEWDIVKASLKLFILLEIVIGILSIIFKRIDLVIGFALGYIINLIAFYFIVQMVDTVMLIKSKSTALTGVFYIVRMLLYALGFYMAVKVEWINLFTVFLGYFVVKITLHLEKYLF